MATIQTKHILFSWYGIVCASGLLICELLEVIYHIGQKKVREKMRNKSFLLCRESVKRSQYFDTNV